MIHQLIFPKVHTRSQFILAASRCAFSCGQSLHLEGQRLNSIIYATVSDFLLWGKGAVLSAVGG